MRIFEMIAFELYTLPETEVVIKRTIKAFICRNNLQFAAKNAVAVFWILFTVFFAKIQVKQNSSDLFKRRYYLTYFF